MSYDKEMLRAIFNKTNRRCHLCHRRLAFSNYGAHGERGAWELDHSIPVAEGGTDHLNNLLPAHTSCNRSKQASSSRSARQAHGKTRAPMSVTALRRAKVRNAVAGAFATGLLGARFAGPVGFWIGAIVGAAIAYEVDPEAL
ncbi:MAG: HNH endonuclease [Gammaproteobacteria bacterium]